MEEKYLELLQFETSRLFLMLSSVNAINFYEGIVPLEYLNNRMKMIVKANPWLNTRLVKVDKRIKLRYAPKDTGIDIKIIKNPGLYEDMKYSDIVRAVGNLLVKNGNNLLNSDEPLFRVIVLIEENANKSAIILSLSHFIADGYTFYSIYKMFDPQMDIIRLNAERVRDYWHNIEARDAEEVTFPLSAKYLLGFIVRFFLAKAPQQIQKVPLEWINDQKKKYNNGTTFVSTNDIITHLFFKISRCDVGTMAITFRNRLANINDTLAGNYEGLLLFTKNDYDTPESIRTTVNTYRRCTQTRLPGFFTCLKSNFATITNWTTFYHHLEFNPEYKCRPLLHLPLRRPGDYLIKNHMVIFRPNPDEISLLYSMHGVDELIFNLNP
jgi:hypothetical protein